MAASSIALQAIVKRIPNPNQRGTSMDTSGTSSANSNATSASSNAAATQGAGGSTTAAASPSETREHEVRSELADNPQATAALNGLTSDPNYAAITDEQKVQALNDFAKAPNAATANYLRGQAETTLNPGMISSTLMRPDSGTLTLGGNTYTIDSGNLTDAQGRRAGTITNDGTVQLDNPDQTACTTTSVYDDISTRVQLQQQVGASTVTSLNLHPADPAGLLASPNINPQMRTRTEAVLEQARREGMDMRVTNGFRSVAEQDALYAQGRTAPGNVVTNARGGSSWHNYGVAVDIAFNNANGQPSWPNNANWTRYGQIAVNNGLEWGGNWQGIQDRPHIEYHPGLATGFARNLLNTYQQGGINAVWTRMGIGQP